MNRQMNRAGRNEFRSRLASASRLELPYSLPHPAAAQGIPAAVLIVWGFSASDEEPQVLLTRRTEKVETHKGQMAFPGGGRDAEDDSPVATAIREAREEVGLEPEHVEVLGTLPEMWTITNYLVTPVVAVLRPSIEELSLVLNEHEIDESFWVPLSRLQESYRREHVARGSIRYPIDVFLEEPYRVWGVTGSLLKNLLERLERLG
jgi:8-oxo-dGTP pyrophosphatase MutT (NUDIX family)